MSKAVLVIDMPKNCTECRLGVDKSIPLERAIQCVACGRWTIATEKEVIPAWCPLAPMPAAVREKKNVYKKILPEYFEAVLEEKKHFELRKDEDDIQAGDILILREWDGECYTGREVVNRVKYVLRNVPQYGLQEGYCIIGW